LIHIYAGINSDNVLMNEIECVEHEYYGAVLFKLMF